MERALYLFLACGLAVGLGASFLTPDFYETTLAAEDGPFEWLTALFLFLGCLMCLRRAFSGGRATAFVLVSLFGALILFFGAGEEISWGQRVFGWASGEFFLENNAQAETNLHNLMVGEVKINKLLFGVTLTLAFVLYFAVFPALVARMPRVSDFADRIGVPVPTWVQGAAFIGALLVMSLVPTGRSAELGEFGIGVLLAAVVIWPRNREALR